MPLEVNVFNKIIEAQNIDNGIRTYTTSKGITKKVMIISDFGDGRMQVKDVDTNATFAVDSDKLK